MAKGRSRSSFGMIFDIPAIQEALERLEGFMQGPGVSVLAEAAKAMAGHATPEARAFLRTLPGYDTSLLEECRFTARDLPDRDTAEERIIEEALRVTPVFEAKALSLDLGPHVDDERTDYAVLVSPGADWEALAAGIEGINGVLKGSFTRVSAAPASPARARPDHGVRHHGGFSGALELVLRR